MDDLRKSLFVSVIVYGAVFSILLCVAGIGLGVPQAAVSGVLVAGFAYLTQAIAASSVDRDAPWLTIPIYLCWAGSVFSGIIGCAMLIGGVV